MGFLIKNKDFIRNLHPFYHKSGNNIGQTNNTLYQIEDLIFFRCIEHLHPVEIVKVLTFVCRYLSEVIIGHNSVDRVDNTSLYAYRVYLLQ